MGLADYVTACMPPDGCTLCRFKAQLQAEDDAWERESHEEVQRHHAFIRQLKVWAKTQSPTMKAKLMAQLTKGERECPTVPPQKRITDWKGWSRSSEKS